MIAGLLQGGSTLLTRQVMIKKRTIAQTVWVSLVVGSSTAAIYVFFRMGFGSVFDLDPIGILLIAFCALLLQLSVCNIYRMLDTQTAGALTLSRIPFAMGLDFIAFGATISLIQLSSATMIIIGGLVVIFSKNKKSSQKNLKKVIQNFKI